MLNIVTTWNVRVCSIFSPQISLIEFQNLCFILADILGSVAQDIDSPYLIIDFAHIPTTMIVCLGNFINSTDSITLFNYIRIPSPTSLLSHRPQEIGGAALPVDIFRIHILKPTVCLLFS